MFRRPDRKPETPIDRQKKALESHAAAIKAQLEKAQQFKEKAPELRAKAEEREQREHISRYHRPVTVEGPADYRYDLHAGREAVRPRKLRKERSKAPLLTFVLFVTLVCVLYYAVRTLWHG